MWVAYIYDPYDGSYGHKYFKSEEKCKTYVELQNSEYGDDFWEMDKIEFEDAEE